MLAGKPILVSSNRIKDPVELSGCGLIVSPDDAAAIAEGILALYSLSPEVRLEMGAKGREYVLEYHNFNVLSRQYEKLFT
jgi:glycosyltransferase involved in cell wall biosynthesis